MSFWSRLGQLFVGYDLAYIQSDAVQGFAVWRDRVHKTEYVLGPKTPWPKKVRCVTRDWDKISYQTKIVDVNILHFVPVVDLDDYGLDKLVYRRVVSSLTMQGQFGMLLFTQLESARRKRKDYDET